MELKYWFCALLTLLLMQCWRGDGCLEQERTALLQLKLIFNSPPLENWGRGDDNSDCCQWERVECDPSTGRIISLILNNTGWERISSDSHLINTSLFLPFEELKSLYLVGNGIAGCIENEGFHKLSEKLSNLEILDLSSNIFNNSILSSLNGFLSLKSLNLDWNNFKATNNMDAADFKKLSRLSNLKFLDISGNPLIGNEILSYLGSISSLKTLIISSCGLEGNISTRGLSKLINLKNLDMSHNKIESLESSQEEQQRLRCINLEFLDLSYNFFNNNVLSFVNEFSNLKSLNIARNNLKGLVDITESDALSSLEELDISDNMLNQFVASTKANTSFNKLKALRLDGIFNNNAWLQQLSLKAFPSLKTLSLMNYNNINQTMLIQELHILSNLEELFLDYSTLSNNFLQSIAVLTSLKSISLGDCGLSGTLPTKGWCDLKNLEELALFGNELLGTLPSCLGNLTYLRFLDISKNQFTGNVASSPIIVLTLLQYLSISKNHFQVPDSFKSFANHSHLKIFLSDFNQLVLEHDNVLTWVPKFQLRIFSLSNCRVEEHLMKPPSFLYYQYDLRHVDLSFGSFGGALPFWLFKNNTRLHILFLNNNLFEGPFHLPSHPSLNVFGIDISKNQIHGQISSNFSLIFPSLQYLFLSENEIKDTFPEWLVGMSSLMILDLSNNQFFGKIPDQLAMGSSLFTLILSNNNLSGKVNLTTFSSQSLIYLYLDGNYFEGEISQLSTFSSLRVLDMSSNNLSGKLPKWTRNLTDFEELAVSNNHFEGSIPEEFCSNDKLRFLDLSHNNLSGSLPSCPSPSYITHLYLNKNRLNGPLTHSFYNSSTLVILDLRENNLTGSIPKWIGTFFELSILLLKGNHFSGQIPKELCELDKLSIIDLSHNQLFGSIPSCLSHLTLKPSTSVSIATGIQMLYLTAYGFVDEIENFGMTTLMERAVTHTLLSNNVPLSDVPAQVEFTTKSWSRTYEGGILYYMSGIDLSCNKLTGLIPPEMGNLSVIRSLNLSHNNLIGPIPSTFSNLKQIESLDLSFNNLNGEIPFQLIELNSLAVFSVAHNNLSGTIPYGKAQFGTFDKSSYEGNPLLCGPPLDNSCDDSDSQSEVPDSLDGKECTYVDMDVFYISFGVTYAIMFLSIVTVLYLNPYWRRAWFYLVERCVSSCYYFILDNIPMFYYCIS